MDIYMESLKGYDVVSASPAKRQKFTSAFFYKVFNMGAAGSYKMKTESFRILSRRVINRVSSMNKTVPYRKAVYAASGLPIKNIQYECEGERLKGRDKLEDAYYLRMTRFHAKGQGFAGSININHVRFKYCLQIIP